nr:MAG TPA: hypothetical protein [Caudoviricetes sp.]
MLLAKYIHINMDKNKRPKLYTLPDTLQTVQHPPPSRSPCAACPRPGVCVVPCVVCLASGTACAAACDVQAVRVRWEVQGATGGVYSRRPAPPGQSRHHRKNKKDPPHLHKTTPIRLCKSPKIPKNTKRPLFRSNLCYT